MATYYKRHGISAIAYIALVHSGIDGNGACADTCNGTMLSLDAPLSGKAPGGRLDMGNFGTLDGNILFLIALMFLAPVTVGGRHGFASLCNLYVPTALLAYVTYMSLWLHIFHSTPNP